MVKSITKTHSQHATRDVRKDEGSNAPDQFVSGVLRGSIDIYRIKRIVSLLDTLLWELKRYEMSVSIYGQEAGKWQGKRESDDIWPIDYSKPYSRPWSDFQFNVLEDLDEKRKKFQTRVLVAASHIL